MDPFWKRAFIVAFGAASIAVGALLTEWNVMASQALIGLGCTLIGKETLQGTVHKAELAAISQSNLSRKAAKMVVVFFLVSQVACAGKWSQIDWKPFVECGAAPAGQLASDVLGTLTNEATNGPGFSAEGKKAMADAALKYGAPAVVCAVKSLLSQLAGISAMSGARMALNPEDQAVVDAGTEFLRAIE